MSLPKSIPSLIGIHGHARAGKDTATDFLLTTFKNHYSLSLADPLKEAAAQAFGIPEDWFHQADLKEEPHPNWGVSPRAIAQFFGTELFRDNIHRLLPQIGKDFWIKRAALRLANQYIPANEGEFEPCDTVVIPDIRFQNEYDWIINSGGIIIHLTRPGADGIVGIAGHSSETELDLHCKERTYTCVNNGSISELHKKIANIVISLSY